MKKIKVAQEGILNGFIVFGDVHTFVHARCSFSPMHFIVFGLRPSGFTTDWQKFGLAQLAEKLFTLGVSVPH